MEHSTIEAMRAELEALKTANAEMQAKLKRGPRALSMKVSTKGALSIYGLGRFPVTLYREQWNRLLDHSDAIREFIVENASTLSVKG